MNVKINNKEVNIEENYSLSSLISDHTNISSTGIAVAVNNKIVSKNCWDSFIVKESDNIIIIKAACGG